MSNEGENGPVRFHAEALELATQHGLLTRPEVEQRLRWLPEWLRELQTPQGQTEMERAMGITLPASLREFWQQPRLVCLLDAWHDLAYLSDLLLVSPDLWLWPGKEYLSFAMHSHSGQTALVELAGPEDPPVWGGEYDPDSLDQMDACFSGFILRQVQAGIRQAEPLQRHHVCFSYYVELVPLPDGPPGDAVRIIAYVGQSVRELTVQQHPGREIIGISRHERLS